VIGLPPSAGADQLTVAVAFPGDALTDVGAPGTVGGAPGVTGLEGADGRPVPTEFVAVTVKVYGVPLVRGETVHVRAPEVVQWRPPGEDVTVYFVIFDPPVTVGADQLTTAAIFRALAATFLGTPGTAAGITAFDGSEGGLVPTLFVAVTVNV